jgi:hypothetical protein
MRVRAVSWCLPWLAMGIHGLVLGIGVWSVCFIALIRLRLGRIGWIYIVQCENKYKTLGVDKSVCEFFWENMGRN